MVDEINSILRQWDRPRYLASLYAPDEKRQPLLALFAFNAEMSRIPLIVSEPQIGLVRLQWWRDTLQAVGKNEPQDHPVATALAGAVAAFRLPLLSFLDLVDAHEHELYADRFPGIPSLEEYLGKTSSVLIQLSALILDPGVAREFAESAGYAGVAYGLAQIVSDPKRHANLIPENETVATLSELARKRLAAARSRQIPAQLLPAFLHVALTETFLAHSGMTPSQWRLQWQLWRAARREVF
jgi:15-cis-phytoene synthase